MEIYIFAKFRVRDGMEGEAEEALREVVEASREEAGCGDIHAFRGIRQKQVFYIYSRWKDDEAFEMHTKLPHTVRFLERMEKLVDEGRDVTRAERID